jgi:hypothetical protein
MSGVQPTKEFVHPGIVLDLAASQWEYGDGPLRLRVERERVDLSIYYDDRRWVEGWRLDDAGAVVGWTQALVPTRVLIELANGARQ